MLGHAKVYRIESKRTDHLCYDDSQPKICSVRSWQQGSSTRHKDLISNTNGIWDKTVRRDGIVRGVSVMGAGDGILATTIPIGQEGILPLGYHSCIGMAFCH